MPLDRNGFKPIVEAARSNGQEVIVRSNWTIYFEEGFGDIPDYCAQNQVGIVASLPCYLHQLSIDYLGNIYDCDFNQMENLPAK